MTNKPVTNQTETHKPSALRRFAPARRRAGIFRVAAVLVVTGLVVASCGGQKKGVCPRIAVLAQAGEITELGANNEIAFRAEMTDVRVECEYRTADLQEMTADITSRMRVTKGPGLQGDSVRFNYFVTVTDRRGNVLNKRVFPVTVNFRGRQSISFNEGSWQFYKMRRGGTGLAYEIWIGFQLTDAQVEYNRRKSLE